ncbi:MAG: ABC transporter ATP-binding protein [Nitrososphaerales archaeon]
MRYEKAGVTPLEVIKQVDLSVKKGSFVTLIGPSGCGKSTLLNIISGMIRPTEGKVLLDGNPITKPDPTKIALVFQEANLYPWKTVLKNVEFGLELRNVPKQERKQRAEKYLDLVGILTFKDYYPIQISGGMQQRVSIARALALETEMVMMDEPFGALDEQSRLILGGELTNIWQKTGKTIVFVTHSLTEAAYLSDEIVVMSARPGRIKETIVNSVERPRDPESIELTQIRRRLWEHISEEALYQAGKRLPFRA